MMNPFRDETRDERVNTRFTGPISKLSRRYYITLGNSADTRCQSSMAEVGVASEVNAKI